MKKLLNKKGFTLMEMLIVVAIIVILVAVSIPTFSGSLNEAKESADAANLRAAKAQATSQFMLCNGDADTSDDIVDGQAYDITDGKFKDASSVTGYGQAGVNKGEKIVVKVDANGATVSWTDTVDPKATTNP